MAVRVLKCLSPSSGGTTQYLPPSPLQHLPLLLLDDFFFLFLFSPLEVAGLLTLWSPTLPSTFTPFTSPPSTRTSAVSSESCSAAVAPLISCLRSSSPEFDKWTAMSVESNTTETCPMALYCYVDISSVQRHHWDHS